MAARVRQGEEIVPIDPRMALVGPEDIQQAVSEPDEGQVAASSPHFVGSGNPGEIGLDSFGSGGIVSA
jgi:hypothetical protein